nr:upf0187 protein [Quercus suber]
MQPYCLKYPYFSLRRLHDSTIASFNSGTVSSLQSYKAHQVDSIKYHFYFLQQCRPTRSTCDHRLFPSITRLARSPVDGRSYCGLLRVQSTTLSQTRYRRMLTIYVEGAIHVDIAFAVISHAAFAALVVYLDGLRENHLAVPSTTVPSLSIVVGLLLVFRNQTSYDRFWQGSQHFTTVVTSIRNMTRSFLTCSYAEGKPPPTREQREDTERTVRYLVALIYAAKHHLRAEWSSTSVPFMLPNVEVERRRRESVSMAKPEYSELLPAGTRSLETYGVGLLIQLSVQVEGYIKRGHDRGWFHAPQASQLTAQLNNLVAAYGSMETIILTPLPVAYLIHSRQVLALYCCVLPFALVTDMGWWAILMVSFITFTLYGIEAIGAQLEDPFGYDKNDIKVDAICEDLRMETNVLLREWQKESDIFSKR